MPPEFRRGAAPGDRIAPAAWWLSARGTRPTSRENSPCLTPVKGAGAPVQSHILARSRRPPGFPCAAALLTQLCFPIHRKPRLADLLKLQGLLRAVRQPHHDMAVVR